MARYTMTSARRAALRKAQLASARVRRGKRRAVSKVRRNKNKIAVVAATGGLALAASGVAGAYYANRRSSKNVRSAYRVQLKNRRMQGRRMRKNATIKNKSVSTPVSSSAGTKPVSTWGFIKGEMKRSLRFR